MRGHRTLSERRAGPRDRRSTASVRRRDDYEHTLAVLDSAHEAFVSMDEAGMIRGWNRAAELTFGWPRQEVIGRELAEVLIPERLRDAHRTALDRFLQTGEAPIIGKRVEVLASHRDGSELPVELTISITRSLGKHVFHAFLHDISDRLRNEQYIRAQLAASRVLAAGPSLADAWGGVLCALGEGLGWEVGQAWVVEDGALRCRHSWSADGVDSSEFKLASEELTLRPGDGLPGAVWRDGRPAWIADVQEDPRFMRATAAGVAGLRAALALPVMGGGEVHGVLELLATRARQPDEPLLQTLLAIGEQLGEFAMRVRAEARLERAEERLHELIESTSFLHKLLENSRALIWAKDRDGRYLVANRALDALVKDGRPAVGATDHELFAAHEADRYRAHDLEVLASGKPAEFEEKIEIDGEEHTHLSVKFPLFGADGTAIAVGGIGTDITQRKRAQLAAEDARVSAVRANREKGELLSRMSHELRTPLNAILGFGQLLEMDLEGGPRDDVRRILTAGRRLLELVDDVLQITREDAGAPRTVITPVEVSHVIADALSAARTRADEREVGLPTPRLDPQAEHVMADPALLADVVGALVENAVRFCPRGSDVEVAATARGDGRARIEVSDRGPGIAAGDVERAYLPFERLDVAPDGDRGKGLGLTLARRHARAMGGDVGHEPREGGGSTFFVELAAAEDAPTSPESNGGGGPISGTLLYIDDSPSNLQIVEQTLELRPDVSLLTAGTGEEGIDAAAREVPDLILLDLNLPDMSGEQVLARLREHERTGGIPVLMLSADASEDTAGRLLGLGAADYLTKPFDLGRFLRVIDERLGGGAAP